MNHVHVFRIDGKYHSTMWHRHHGYSVKHRVDVDEAHPESDPRRKTLATWDGKRINAGR